jgi:hypothetical protein
MKSRMVLAAPGPLLTPPPSSSPPKTPIRSYSVQIRSQNEEKNYLTQTVHAPTEETCERPGGGEGGGGDLTIGNSAHVTTLLGDG